MKTQNTLIKITSLIISLTLSAISTAGEHMDYPCIKGNIFSANYTIKKETYEQHHQHKNTQQKSLTLWRDNHRIAHENSNPEITSVWYKLRNGRISLTRYFDKYQRGIEYEPVDIQGEKQEWSSKQLLVSKHLLTRLHKDETIGKSCNQVVYYSGKFADRHIKVALLKQQNLLLEYVEIRPDGKIRWTMDKLTSDKTKVKQAFDKYKAYSTTDYADVGDNESDPFLSKMITMGFIEHGASGFYDADGNALEGHGHKH